MPRQKNPDQFVKGGTFCFYSDATKEEHEELRAKLNQIARELGYVGNTREPKGRFMDVLKALADGALIIIPADDLLEPVAQTEVVA